MPESPHPSPPQQAITPRSVVSAVVFTALISVVVATLAVVALIGKGPAGPQGEQGIQGPPGPRAAATQTAASSDVILQAIRDNASEVAMALGDAFDPPFSQISSDASSAKSEVRKVKEDLSTLCQDLLAEPTLSDITLDC